MDKFDLGINLHDSSILQGNYNEYSQTLIFSIELNGCMQGSDVDNAPDIIPGKILFENAIFSKEIEVFLKKINSSSDMDAEVQRNTLEISDKFLRLNLFVCIFNYKKDTQEYLCLDILFTSCKWKTESKRGRC